MINNKALVKRLKLDNSNNVNRKISDKNFKKTKELKYIPFYEIKHPKNDKSSYLLLTKHVISSKKFAIPEIVIDKLKISNGILFECSPYTDTSVVHSKAIKLTHKKIKKQREEMYLLIQKLLKTNVKTINIDSAKKLFKHYDKMLKLSEKMLEIRKSMGGSKDHLMISIAHLAYGLLYPKDCLFMENELLNIAKLQNKEISALDEDVIIHKENEKELVEEISDTALEIINNLALPELFAFHSSIEEELSKEYIDGNTNGFKKRSKLDIYKKNVIERNLNWLPKIMEKSGYVFTIGADHFPGKNGIKNLLEQKGYSISQVQD